MLNSSFNTHHHETLNKKSDTWHRLSWIWSAVFYIALALPFVVAFLDRQTPLSNLRWIAVLAVTSSVWHWLGAIELPKRMTNLRERPFLSILYLLVAIALWHRLVNLHSVFFFLLFGLYGQIYNFLPLRWAISGSSLLTALVAYESGVQLSWESTLLWIFVVVSVVGLLFTLWINAIILQSAQRRELIQTLERTQANLAAVERKAGILQERQRLAHEIHDTLAQGFISIVMHLEAAEQALVTDKTKVEHHMQEAKRTARENITQARRVVQNLRPLPLEEANLPDAIQRVVEQWSAECRIVAAVQVTGESWPLPPDVEVTLLRIVQEALANVRKHSGARWVSVTLSYMEDIVVLDVQDDGVGLNGGTAVSADTKGGFGLTAMRERVEQAGGTLLLESEPGAGTTVVVQIPVNSYQL